MFSECRLYHGATHNWSICVCVFSAGVGRTGTFILIDRLLQSIQHENTIDIFGTILEMRECRANMIQTEVSRYKHLLVLLTPVSK